MWPIWLLKRVDTREPVRRTVGKNPSYQTISRKIRVRSVCKTCNNGWMSRLESKSIPLVGSLLADISLNLDTDYQELASTWAIKTAMVLDSVANRSSKYYLRAECEALKDRSRIPLGTMIWLGRYIGRSLHSGAAHFTAHSNDSPVVADCCTTTIVIGHLVVQVLNLRVRAEYKDKTVRIEPNLGRWNESLVPVWPITSTLASWPPRLSFSNSGGRLTSAAW